MKIDTIHGVLRFELVVKLAIILQLAGRDRYVPLRTYKFGERRRLTDGGCALYNSGYAVRQASSLNKVSDSVANCSLSMACSWDC